MKLSRITEMYLERIFNDMKREDMNVIKRNLKRMNRPELVETLLTNTMDNVWISADSLFEFIRNATNDTFEKIYVITNVKSDNRDDVVKEYCFKVNIDDYGDLTITIECNVEGLTWTSKEYLDYMVERGYMRHSENKKSERYNIPFRYKAKFSRTVSLDSIREYILKSE